MNHDSIFTVPIVATAVDETTVTETTANATTVNDTTVDANTLTTDTITSDGNKIGLFRATIVTKPTGGDQAEVTSGDINNKIDGLIICGIYPQYEIETLRDKCEELAEDARNLQTMVHALSRRWQPLRAALVNLGLINSAS